MSFRRLIVIGSLFGVGLAHAAAPPRRTTPRPLVPCTSYLDSAPMDADRTVGNLVRRFTPYVLKDLPNFAGHAFELGPVGGDGGGGGPRVLALPPLRHDQTRWRREHWTSRGRSLYLYDVGFKHLEEDALNLNTFVLAQLLAGKPSALTFVSDPDRARALHQLNLFREAMMDRTLRHYRLRRGPAASPSDRDPVAAILRDNSNADVLGLAITDLPWTAALGDIKGALRAVMQITYDRPRDFVGPSFDGLLDAASARRADARALPFVLVTDLAQRESFATAFWNEYRTSNVCEVTWTARGAGPEREFVDRLYREVFARARRHRCDVLVMVVGAARMRTVERYGFRRDRVVPTAQGRPRYLALLRVKSPEFLDVFRRLNQESSH